MYLLETELKLERIENKPNNNGINDNLHATTFFFFLQLSATNMVLLIFAFDVVNSISTRYFGQEREISAPAYTARGAPVRATLIKSERHCDGIKKKRKEKKEENCR